MKVIDLLNKIANGEEVPSKVKYNGITYNYCSLNKQGLKYIDLDEEGDVFYKYLTGVVNSLNYTVEIIEEQPEIDIQRIDIMRIELDNNGIASKIINQLVQAVKQLDNKMKGE